MTWMVVGALALSIPAIGCGSAGTEPQTQAGSGTTATDSNTTVAPVAANSHGMVRFVSEALSQVPLRADQRTAIEKLAADSEARHAEGKTTRAALTTAIASQIEAGKIDRTALQPQIDAMTAEWQKNQPLDTAAFQQLHDLLDASQRQAFVDAFRANMQAKHAEHKAKDGEGHHGGPGAKMDEWATALNLTDAQKDQIKAAMTQEFMAKNMTGGNSFQDRMKEFKADHDKRSALFDQFKNDDFKVDALMPGNGPDAKEHATEMATHMLHFAEIAMPTLTADQRKIAADRLRAKATAPEMEEHGPF
ncbi:MAG TPA: hypothetical protein VF407_21700 [Polyangiaceae bacterium]